MNKTSLWIRTVIILAITITGIYLVFGPRRTPTASDFTWQGIKNNLAANINLGLDLKGGSHLVMRVKTEEYLKNLTVNNEVASLQAAKEAKDDGGEPLPVTDASYVAENGIYQFTINLTDASKADAVVSVVKKKVDVVNWNQSTSGSAIIWSLPAQAQARLKEQATDQAMKIIDSRINAFGVKEPNLGRQGAADSGQILLQMPGLENPERVKELIGRTSQLRLVKIVSTPNPNLQTYPTREAALQSMGGKETDTKKVFPFTERDDAATPASNKNSQDKKPSKFVVVEFPVVVDGTELRDASAIQGKGGGTDYQISFSFKPTGAQKFGDWTGNNIGNYMGVLLDTDVKSIAYIKSQIFDSGEISGKFKKADAEDLALTLKSGALPADIEYLEERTVGPSLGADSIRSGVTASVGGLIFVILFMLVYYRGSGINAVIALMLNMVLTIAALIMFGSTLTLPGIAGLILGIGMAVDSNVLIFERIREELRLGFSVAESIGLGFDRAFVTIIDTHITTIISSVILYVTGSGPIKGFAVTLILGLLINLFTAVFVSRTIFNWELSLKPNKVKLSI